MEYETNTLNLAAVLSLYFPLLRVEYMGRRANFIFQDSEELQKLASDYWSNTVENPPQPQLLLNAVKQFKARIAEEGRQL